MHDPIDPKLKAMLEQHWQAPAASPDATARLLQAARATPLGVGGRLWQRWTLPGAAAAAAIAALWLVNPRALPVQTEINDDVLLSYVFATYELEELS